MHHVLKEKACPYRSLRRCQRAHMASYLAAGTSACSRAAYSCSEGSTTARKPSRPCRCRHRSGSDTSRLFTCSRRPLVPHITSKEPSAVCRRHSVALEPITCAPRLLLPDTLFASLSTPSQLNCTSVTVKPLLTIECSGDRLTRHGLLECAMTSVSWPLILYSGASCSVAVALRRSLISSSAQAALSSGCCSLLDSFLFLLGLSWPPSAPSS